MLKRLFSRQARKPSGVFGRYVAAWIFERGNAAINRRMAELVAANGDERILEIGFGTGTTMSAMADALEGGMVEGIDFSDAMVAKATKRNRGHIRGGRVRLVRGDFDAIAYPPEGFDTLCSANTIYFWPDQATTMTKIGRVLKPGGKVVLGFVGKSRMTGMPLDMGIFSPVSREDVVGLLSGAGFSRTETHLVGPPDRAEYCVVGWK